MAEVCHVVRYASTVLNFVDRSSSREAPTMRGSKSPSSVWPIYSIRLRTLIGQGDQIYRARSSLESKAF